MTYKLIATRDEALLEFQVNQLLTKGWQLQGGISITWNGLNPVMFAQAMVKSDE